MIITPLDTRDRCPKPSWGARVNDFHTRPGLTRYLADQVMSAPLAQKWKRKSELRDEVWCDWCKRLHLKRGWIPLGGNSNNILHRASAQNVKPRHKLAKSKGKKSIILVRSFQKLSVCNCSLNRTWQQRWQGEEGGFDFFACDTPIGFDGGLLNISQVRVGFSRLAPQKVLCLTWSSR